MLDAEVIASKLKLLGINGDTASAIQSSITQYRKLDSDNDSDQVSLLVSPYRPIALNFLANLLIFPNCDNVLSPHEVVGSDCPVTTQCLLSNGSTTLLSNIAILLDYFFKHLPCYK